MAATALARPASMVCIEKAHLVPLLNPAYVAPYFDDLTSRLVPYRDRILTIAWNLASNAHLERAHQLLDQIELVNLPDPNGIDSQLRS